MSSRRSRGFLIVSALVSLLAVLVLAGCPRLVTDEILHYAEDETPPVLAVASPESKSPYSSTVVVTGTVLDYANDQGESGRVDGLTFHVVDHESISSDDVEVAEDGAFTFSFSTEGLTGDKVIHIEAVDWNGNTTSLDLELTDPEVGPDIVITSPEDNSLYRSSVTVQGTVFNRGSTTATDEVSSLSYEILGTALAGELEFDETTGEFSFSFSAIGEDGTLVIRVTAEDRNERITTITTNILEDTAGPYIVLSPALDGTTYGLTVNVLGTVADSEDEAGLTGEVASLSFVLNSGDPVELDFAADGSFTYSFSTIGISGSMFIKLISEDLNDHVTEHRVTMNDNLPGPEIAITTYPLYYSSTATTEITVQGTVGDPNNLFNDQMTYEVSIPFAHEDTVPAANIDGDGNWWFTFTLSDATKTGTGNLVFTLIALDKAGRRTEDDVTVVDDTAEPGIGDGTIAADNTYIDVALTKPGYGNADGTGALDHTDFVASVSDPDVSGVSATSATRTDDSALQGGELVIRLHITVTGIPSGDELVTVAPADGSSIYDHVGNAVPITETAVVTLNDEKQPTVLSVSSNKTNGAYTIDEVIDVRVQFSENVTVPGAPTLVMETGPSDQTAVYSSTASDTVVFNYTVVAGDISADLDYTTSTALQTAGSITDIAGNIADLNLPVPGATGSLSANKNLEIDTDVAAVDGISAAPSANPAGPGDIVTITVSFDEWVQVSGGNASLDLNNGATATCSDASSGTNLDFTYEVGSSSSETVNPLDVDGSTALSGPIEDAVGLPAELDLGTYSFAATAIEIDTTGPTVQSVNGDAIGSPYAQGESFNITVTFSDNVQVSGSPTFTVSTGSTAAYNSGASSGADVVFTYTVGSSDNEDPLTNSTNPISLAGGTIKDLRGTGNDAATDIAAGALAASGIVLDTADPVCTGVVTSGIDNTYGFGDPLNREVEIKIAFDEKVTVDVPSSPHAAELSLSNGEIAACDDNTVATYNAGQSRWELTFTYTVSEDDPETPTLDYDGTSALSGTFTDDAGNDISGAEITLVHADGGTLATWNTIGIDTTAPWVDVVLGVVADNDASPGDGLPEGGVPATHTFNTAETMYVHVKFSEEVTVASEASISFADPTAFTVVAATSSSSTNGWLTFTKLIVSGMGNALSIDYVGAGSLNGTIRDLAGNPADQTLAVPDAAGSISDDQTIHITAP